MNKTLFTDGLHGLKNPILPLVRIIQLLYITGPFTTIAEILAELNEPIETNGILYGTPKENLSPYLDILQEFERLKNSTSNKPLYAIFDQEGLKIEAMEAMGLWVSHHMLNRELERINSQLCGPCGCDLCCIGPSTGLRQEFFEIPLLAKETDLFPLPTTNTEESRQLVPDSETTLLVNGLPFYKGAPSLTHWQSGWSLILPKETSCPHLDRLNSTCQIYLKRPDVCRRPQIFSYLLEPRPRDDNFENEHCPKNYTHAGKLLAIWDCPYVKDFQSEIAAYAEVCDIEPIFKKNKE